eukprot:jgi/Undpi1/12860/HiC_scaffold_7.g02527.m1
MVRMTSASSALLVALSASTLSNAHHFKYKFLVRNITYKQPFSPILIFAHTEEIKAFQVGEKAGPEMRTMAEDGDLSELLALADDKDVEPVVCGYTYGTEALSPGEEQWFTLKVDKEKCPDGFMLSMVSMLVNTNDAFMGLESLRLEGEVDETAYIPAYDAGTEENNELCSHIPGPACSSTSGNKRAGPGEGFVHFHRGFHGVGGELEAADYDWRTAVAEVYISGSGVRVRSGKH